MATISNNKNNAKLVDLDPYIAAGIDPKTGLPVKMGGGRLNCASKQDIKRQLRILDEQDAVNRFTWYNLPPELSGNLIEQILYYKGQGAFFKLNDKFYFLPYTLAGSLDVYGRFTGITPLQYRGTTKDDEGKELIKGLVFDPRYEVALPEDYLDYNVDELEAYINKSAVIVKDTTEQLSQTVIGRQILNDPLLDLMSECLPFMRTALLNSTGVTGVKVASQDEYSNVAAANHSIQNAALNGETFVPISGTQSLEFQTLTPGGVNQAEQFLQAMQSLDNYRLSLYGLDNGGIFQKRSHMLEAEQAMNAGKSSLALTDSLNYRQRACLIANSIFGTNWWVDISESALGIDRNLDGEAAADEQPAQPTPKIKEDNTDAE